jgi:hypothetical protein
MEKSERTDRVLIAITEFSPVDVLWRAALQRIGDTQVELLALYFSEDHWQRAASLPFTREISRVSGARMKFTRQRAEQLNSEAIDRAREITQRLAAESNRSFGFEVLSGKDIARLKDFVAGTGSILIATSPITRLPFFPLISSLNCRIELVELVRAGAPEPPEATDDDN